MKKHSAGWAVTTRTRAERYPKAPEQDRWLAWCDQCMQYLRCESIAGAYRWGLEHRKITGH